MTDSVAPTTDIAAATASVAAAVGKATSVVVFDNVTYDLIKGPDDASPLVQVARANILQSMEIDKLVRHLNRTDDLLHIAACGVAGFMNPNTSQSLSAQVMSLQYKLRKNTGDMASALLRFGVSAGDMIPILRAAFTDLYALYEDDCLSRLARCAAVASEMAATSDALKGTFQGLADEAQKIAEDTTQTHDLHEQARQAAQTRQAEIQAQQAKTEELKKSLEAQIPQVKGWYEEAKAAQNTADGRMFTMAIVGSITKALGDGLAAGLQFKAGPAVAGAQLATALASKSVAAPDSDKKTDEKSQRTSDVLTTEAAGRVADDAVALAEGKYKAAQEKTQKAQAALDELDGPYKQARDDYESARRKKTADAAAKKDAYDKLQGPHDDAESALDAATAEEEKAKAAYDAASAKQKSAGAAKDAADASAPLAGVAKGLSSAGASAQDAASSYADIAANYGKEKAKYLDMLMDLQKQERDALGAIAQFAVQMKTEQGVEQLEQAAVESLHIAVGVLKTVVVILQDVTQFWTQIAIACRRLAGTEVQADIQIYMKRSRQERIEEYSSADFILRLLLVAAQWHALQLVAGEYRTATMQAYTKLGNTYQINLAIPEAHAEAKRLAALLEVEVTQDIQKSIDVSTQIATAKTETTKLIAAAGA